jgi:hypothetical protein
MLLVGQKPIAPISTATASGFGADQPFGLHLLKLACIASELHRSEDAARYLSVHRQKNFGSCHSRITLNSYRLHASEPQRIVGSHPLK